MKNIFDDSSHVIHILFVPPLGEGLAVQQQLLNMVCLCVCVFMKYINIHNQITALKLFHGDFQNSNTSQFLPTLIM